MPYADPKMRKLYHREYQKKYNKENILLKRKYVGAIQNCSECGNLGQVILWMKKYLNTGKIGKPLYEIRHYDKWITGKISTKRRPKYKHCCYLKSYKNLDIEYNNKIVKLPHNKEYIKSVFNHIK